jgi:hypothetical protein
MSRLVALPGALLAMLHGVFTLRSLRVAVVGACLWCLSPASVSGVEAQVPSADLPPAPRTAMVIDAATRGIDPRVGQHVTLVMREALAAMGYAIATGADTLAAAQGARMPYPPRACRLVARDAQRGRGPHRVRPRLGRLGSLRLRAHGGERRRHGPLLRARQLGRRGPLRGGGAPHPRSRAAPPARGTPPPPLATAPRSRLRLRPHPSLASWRPPRRDHPARPPPSCAPSRRPRRAPPRPQGAACSSRSTRSAPSGPTATASTTTSSS